MKKILDYLKQNKRYELLIKGLVALIFPLVLCVIYCAVQGKAFWQVYLPSGEWNDELFYFKQVEGIVKFGFPRGYFGFNESRAEVLSFAAWSPVLVFPWIIWGLVFGWNLLSPIICNIVLFCVTSCAFVMITKVTWKQLISLLAGILFFIPFERYMLSGMPEIICFCMVILFNAFLYSYLKENRAWKMGVMLGMSAVMTLMRPYLLIFMLLPIALCFVKKKAGAIIASVLVFLLTGISYVLIKKYLGASYFTPLFSMNWLTDFITYGFGTGLHHLASRLFYMSKDFLGHSIQGVKTGLASGAFFVTFIAMMCVFLVQTILDAKKLFDIKKNDAKKKETETSDKENSKELLSKIVFEANYLFAMFGMLAALLLMYKLTEGSKHLLTFIAGGIFVLALMNSKYFVKNIVIALCVYFFIVKATSAYDYAVPFAEPDIVRRNNEWQDAFEENLELSTDTLSYDNVVIWNLYDKRDGSNVYMKWQRLYSLPKGCGISCCEPGFVMDNIDNLKSGYLTTLTGGETDEMLRERGEIPLYYDDEVTLYALH